MSAKHRIRLLLAGLLAAGAWFALSFRDGAAPRPAAAALPAAPRLVSTAPAQAPVPPRAWPDRRAWPPDPFRTPGSSSRPDNGMNSTIPRSDLPARPFVLKAILDGQNPRAILDGQVVAVGDRLPGGATVAAIDAFSVTLTETDGRDVRLQLPE